MTTNFDSVAFEIERLRKNDERYRWLRRKYAAGQETYFAESCADSEDGIDAEIDAKMALGE